ncbi:MAG: hypothetical protein JXR96_07420 [Deltaproteobacteria bacterium]|nr:hypothetical protein [Deltaproteobacteria bacterium]
MRRLFLFAVLPALALACSGSGGNDTDPDAGGLPECTAEHSLCARITVPADFTGTPRQLMALGFASLPPSGMPSAFFATIDDPAIGKDEPYDLVVEDLTASGEIYFVISLLMEGGGTMSPEPGIDYVGYEPEPVDFGASPINLGEIPLSLYQDAGRG